MERIITPTAFGIFLLGLLFVAGGFGAFVAGHMEGILMVFLGVAMFWAGWVGTQARGLSCLLAAVLNALDAAITLASWTREVNPFVLSLGPTLFVVAKLLCSFAITLFARSAEDPRKGGYLLSVAFALILAWNFSQLSLLSFHTRTLTEAFFWGTAASIAVALATLMVIAFRRGRASTSGFLSI